ncbi:MAG: SWEET family sugar transporter [Methanobrevibacter sp.]|nr:SWEET family sugar transporter [Candidatus Methanovirga aequatorialis]
MEFFDVANTVGALASFFAIALNLAVILQIRDMWNRQTHEGMNPILIICMFFNSFFWTIRGFLTSDMFMLVPNFLGTVFTPVVLFLIVYFSHKKYLAKRAAKMRLEEEILKAGKDIGVYSQDELEKLVEKGSINDLDGEIKDEK